MIPLTVHGACPHDCPDTCGVLSVVRDGKAVEFRADPHHPVADGWLCAKVRPYLDHVYHPDRVLYPLRRVGPKGAGTWQRITWDDALAEIGSRWKSIIDQYGAEAILPYSYSGTLGMVQMSLAADFGTDSGPVSYNGASAAQRQNARSRPHSEPVGAPIIPTS